MAGAKGVASRGHRSATKSWPALGGACLPLPTKKVRQRLELSSWLVISSPYALSPTPPRNLSSCCSTGPGPRVPAANLKGMLQGDRALQLP